LRSCVQTSPVEAGLARAEASAHRKTKKARKRR
jgi:hypothetical protein